VAYWLMKSEPDVYSISDLKRDGRTEWEGVRNYQARNFMTKDMKPGDTVLFYHSNATPPGIAGIGVISRVAQPDASSWNPKSPYYDPKSTPENPRWFCVQVEYKAHFTNVISLDQLRQEPRLQTMEVLKKGQRLSIMPVRDEEVKVLECLTKLTL
jgi:predicted RNA-binding protein with PUA-like domain